MQAPGPRPPTPRLSSSAAATALALALGCEVWAWLSTDRDFYLPDVIHPLAMAVLGTFLVTALIPWSRARSGVRLAVALVVASLLILEVRVRTAEGPHGESRVERTGDRLLRYRYRPGVDVAGRDGRPFRINHLGLQEDERAIPKPADVYRIVVLTGSIANDGAVPFDDRFVRRLERELGTIEGRRVETINVSCEGYSVVQQVRLLETVGLRYEPDLVLLAYMLTAATIQDGSSRRLGNSYFVFRFLPWMQSRLEGSWCAAFAPFHERYTYDLVVRNSFERLALLSRVHGFRAAVGVLPVVERFDDPLCSRLYSQVAATAREAGLPATQLAEAFRGQDFHAFQKQGQANDVCHPNAAGHARLARALAEFVRGVVASPAR